MLDSINLMVRRHQLIYNNQFKLHAELFKLHKTLIKTGLISRLILKIFFLPKNECSRPRQSDGN